MHIAGVAGRPWVTHKVRPAGQACIEKRDQPSMSARVEFTRGRSVESTHQAVIAVAGEGGRLLASAGDPVLEVFFRSSAKPFQAVPVLE